jgi:putative endopeptidase
MDPRRLALVLLLAACPAKSPAPSGTSVSRPASSPSAPGGGSAASVAGPTPAPDAPPGAAVETRTLAEVGIEAASLDRSADPCVDFYQFACGGWLAAHPIPADRASWSRFSEIDEKNKTALRTLLESAADKPEPQTKQIGDFYTSCMDEAAIEKAGLTAIKPLLAKTTRTGTARGWLAALAELHRHGIWAGFTTSAAPDLAKSTVHVTTLDSGDLGLPDRDYYLNADFAQLRDGYREHVGRMLALAGVAKPEAAAADVLAIETELAKLTKSRAERRDVDAANNPTDLGKLAKQARSIDWKAYFKALDVKPSTRISVGTPAYFAGLDAVRKRFAPKRWAGFFTYHLLRAAAPSLPKPFADEGFALRKLVTGVGEQPPRYKRCIDATTAALGEQVGHAYIDRYFPPSSRQTAQALVDAIAAAMHDEIRTLDWMSEQTRTTAQDKLAKLERMVGYPDSWRTYDFTVARDDFAGNALRAAAFETRRVLTRTGKPVDRREWFMNAFKVDAYYNASANNMALPAGILQPPYFGADRSIAANLGGLGMVIGHELTHGFDDQGAKFDASGNLASWWQPDDRAKFDERGTCVSAMYDSFEALPKHYVSGKLTLGEDIADLGGVKLAFQAYRTLRKDAPRPIVADGFTEDQQFFLAVGQAWCFKLRPAEAQRLLTTDAHAPPKFRVYGALRNLPAFAQAFSCAQGTPMHPEASCSVW